MDQYGIIDIINKKMLLKDIFLIKAEDYSDTP